MNEKPRDPLYPRGFEETKELKNQLSQDFPKPNQKEDDELTPLKKLNRRIESQFGDLLSNYLLKCDKEISLSRKQLYLIKIEK